MNRTVMIADDDPLVRNILRRILESDGYRVIAEAENGLEAVESYREHKPAIAIIDNIMPYKNGIDAIREIVAHDGDAKIIMCSSMRREAIEQCALLAGANELVSKPFTVQQILQAVGRLY